MDIHGFYRPFLRHFRTLRMRRFYQRFGITVKTRILDVGGTGLNWSFCPFRPSLTFLNLRHPPKEDRNVGEWVIADGRYLPFKDRAFEIVYSNSVIEHLGDRASQQIFAQEIARVGIRYFVQTPNKRFPIEPHLLTPFIHYFIFYLPRSLQCYLLRYFTLWGWITHPTLWECERFLQEVRLLDEHELRRLFPDAEIWRERFLGLTKSLIAIKL